MMKCPHCGMPIPKGGEYKEPEEKEKPEVEVSIEGDPDSVRSLLKKLIPKGK
jgi:hypothetical protein